MRGTHEEALEQYVRDQYNYHKRHHYQQGDLIMTSPQRKQVQTQTLKQTDHEQQALIQYYVYQDFQNLINLLYSFKAVKQYFSDQPQHHAIALSRNKILVQLNLSNSIHYDLQQQYKSTQEQRTLSNQKKKVQQMLSNIRLELDQECQAYLDQYEQNNLKEHVKINQIKLEMQSQNYNFNQNVLQQLIPQISFVDQQTNQLRNSNLYNIPSEIEIKKTAKDYQKQTQNNLSHNYPQSPQKKKSHVRQDYLASFINEQDLKQQQYQNISESAIYHFDKNPKHNFNHKYH